MYRCDGCGNLETDDQEETYKSCTISGGDVCEACKKLEGLNTRIAEAKKAFEDLLQQRRALKVEINRRHESLVNRLPLEIVASIFEFTMADSPESYEDFEGQSGDIYVFPKKSPPPSPLPLGAVCQTWRRVAWSTPRLWTSPNVNLCLPEEWGDFAQEVYEFKAHMLSDWIARSGGLLFSISLYANPEEAVHLDGYIHRFFDLINDAAGRCRSLSLELPARFITRCNTGTRRYSALETLKISSTSKWDDPDVVEFNPGKEGISGRTALFLAPKVLDIKRLRVPQLIINWNHVTDVTAELSSQSHVLELVANAPQLQALKVSGPFFEDVPTISPRLHQNLRVLDIDSRFASTVVSKLTLPAIESISLALHEQDFPIDIFLSFLARSGSGGPHFHSFGPDGRGRNFAPDDVESSLKELYLIEARFSDDGDALIQVCRATPNLTLLDLSFLKVDQPLNTSKFFTALSHKPSEAHGQHQIGETWPSRPPFLPELQTLRLMTDKESDIPWSRIPNFYLPFDDDDSHVRPLGTIIIGRRRTRQDEPTSIDPDTLEALRKLIYVEGVNLTALDVVGSKTFDLIRMPPTMDGGLEEGEEGGGEKDSA